MIVSWKLDSKQPSGLTSFPRNFLKIVERLITVENRTGTKKSLVSSIIGPNGILHVQRYPSVREPETVSGVLLTLKILSTTWIEARAILK